MKTPLPATAELHYRATLEQIAALANATEMRGPLEDIGVPDHKVKAGGWVPIHPRLKDGLCYAAKIAKDALDAENCNLHLNIQPTGKRESADCCALRRPYCGKARYGAPNDQALLQGGAKGQQ